MPSRLRWDDPASAKRRSLFLLESMSIQVHRASRADAYDLAKLNQAFNEIDTPVSWIEDALSSPRTPEIVLVARSRNQAVGFACLRIAYSFCYDKPQGEISELFVVESHRRQGIAKRLVEQLLKEAKAFGVFEIIVLTGGQNETGQAFYQALDFERATTYRFTSRSNRATLSPFA